MYANLNFNHYPGYFSFYTAIFFIMATLNAFSAMYSIFYESDDVKLYAHLPIKSSELYLAKVISSFGMGVTFLMPLLSLFFIAYWQMAGLFGDYCYCDCFWDSLYSFDSISTLCE